MFDLLHGVRVVGAAIALVTFTADAWAGLCADACVESDRGFQLRGERAGVCTRLCRRNRAACDDADDIQGCRELLASCARKCTRDWRDLDATGRQNRRHCLAKCLECKRVNERSGTSTPVVDYCVQGTGRGKFARCCGRDGEPTCCADRCCTGGKRCCESPSSSGTCVDTDTDTGNCGDCNVGCNALDQCFAGVCTAPTMCSETCGDGLKCCPKNGIGGEGACIDVRSDRNNCGRCGKLCADDEDCVGRKCAQRGNCNTGLIICPDTTGHYFPTCMKPDGVCCSSGISNSQPEFKGGVCCPAGAADSTHPFPPGFVCCSGGNAWWACPPGTACTGDPFSTCISQ